MADLKRTETGVRAERAVLVQVSGLRDPYDADETFEELANLAQTAGAAVVGRLRQKRTRRHPRTYLGKGKVAELAELCQQVEADVIICDDELSTSQVKALEDALTLRVVDRSEVILDIFAAHARTKQAKLQVELAQLEYAFPRLKRLWTHLDRSAGGSLGGPAGGGIGVRGPGEKQLETDRRVVQKHIYDLKKDLEAVEKQRRTATQDRSARFGSVAFVGYTNAGKSSLMNALTGANVSVRDRLFETLDTRTRRWELPDGRAALLSDTVGFVRKFPHHLAASFRATLDEARDADLLLHVVDASKHDSEEEIAAVNEVLKDIDCLGKPTIYLFNKIDLVEDVAEVALLKKLVGEVICTSAVTGKGLDELRARVAEQLSAALAEVVVRTPVSNGKLAAFLHASGQVLQQTSDGETMELTVRMSPDLVRRVQELGGTVSPGGPD